MPTVHSHYCLPCILTLYLIQISDAGLLYQPLPDYDHESEVLVVSIYMSNKLGPNSKVMVMASSSAR